MHKLQVRFVSQKAVNWVLFALVSLFLVNSVAIAAKPDNKARALLDQMAATMRSAKSLETKMEIVYTRTDKVKGARVHRSSGPVRLRKPNYAYAVTSGDTYQLCASDGKSCWNIFGHRSTYVKGATDLNGSNIFLDMGFLVNYFFTQNADIYSVTQDYQKLRYIGKSTVDGITTDVIELTSGGSTLDEPSVLTFYIGPDHILRRSVIYSRGEKVDLLYDTTYHDVQLDHDLPVESFKYAPPKDSHQYQMRLPVEKLLGIGKAAPNFDLPTPNSGKISLAGVRSKSTAVIVNFWFYNCPACQEEFPHLQKLYTELKGKGVSLIAVDTGDKADVIRNFLKEKGYTFPVAMDKDKGGAAESYGVAAYPTNYVVDSKGKVIYRGIGFDEKAMRAALKSAGVK